MSAAGDMLISEICGRPSSGRCAAAFSRKREKGFGRRRGTVFSADEARGARPLPPAGEGWGEGRPCVFKGFAS